MQDSSSCHSVLTIVIGRRIDDLDITAVQGIAGTTEPMNMIGTVRSGAARGKGAGSPLISAVISATEAEDFSTLHASMFPENEASVALHLHVKHGFRIQGRRERIGQLDGEWQDTLILEGRSQVIGND